MLKIHKIITNKIRKVFIFLSNNSELHENLRDIFLGLTQTITVIV